MKPGKVYLVGAGPGDPELLTIRGLECLECADVVVADYLANPILLNYSRPDAEKIRLGRKGTAEYLNQQQITTLLIDRAREGKHVVRLKNGDPFVFGKGGEEAEAMAEHGITCEVVPGVSAAVACPAYAGIPVVHRQYASQVTFITGHEDPLGKDCSVDWKNLAQSQGTTLVIMMGLKTLPSIFEALYKNGMRGQTPVAVISQGTLPQQQVVVETLETIGRRLESLDLELPVMAVVGEVVNLEQSLRWFDEDTISKRAASVHNESDRPRHDEDT